MRSLAVVVAVGALLLGCPPPAPSAGPPVRLELTPAALLLPSVGATGALRMKAFDAEGREAAVTGATFASSGASVTVDDTGNVTAAALGNARITVTVGGLTARAAIVVAEPAAGAVLVTDEQIVGDLRPLDPAARIAPGYRYDVTLTGATLAVGDLLIGTGALPVGGRVTAVNGDAVTIELVTLDVLFPKFELNETFTLADEPFQLNPAVTESFDVVRQPSGEYTFTLKDGVEPKGTSRKKTRAPTGKTEFEVGPVECTVEASLVQVSIAKLEITLDPGLSLERKWSDEEKRVIVTSNARALFNVKPVLQSQFEGKLTCELEIASVPLPLPGPIGLVLGFNVPFGVGFELEVKAPIAPGVSLEFKKDFSATARAGLTCIFGDCVTVSDFTNTSTPAMGPTFPPPVNFSLPGDLKVEASAYVYGFVGLEFGSSAVLSTAAGAAGWRRLEADLAALKLGLKLEAKYATELAQAKDPSYANEYRLLAELGFEALGDLESFFAFVKLTPLKLEIKLPFELATSPKGTLRVSPGTFDTADNLTFDVDLQDAGLSFPLIGYNARAVTLYKKVDAGAELALIQMTRQTFTEGQQSLRFTDIAGGPGTASDYVAFLETNFLSPLTIELDPGSVLELGVEFPTSISATAATPLRVTAQTRDLRTNSVTAAPGVTIRVQSMDASASSMSFLTDMSGVVTAEVRPNTGVSLVFLDIEAEAPNGSTARASRSAMVTMGPVCNPANPRTTSSEIIIESEADAVAAADIAITSGGLRIGGSGPAYAVDLPCLTSVNGVQIYGSAITSVKLPSLKNITLGNLVVTSTTNLTSLRLPALTSIAEGITIGRFLSGPFVIQGNARLEELVIGPARTGVRVSGSARMDVIANPLLTDLSGLSSNIILTRGFFFGTGTVANGFGVAEGLAVANRLGVTGMVCSGDGVNLPTCYTGPPWVP